MTASWAPPYAEAADLRRYMSLPAVDTMDQADQDLDTYIYDPAIEAASRIIDVSAGRQFGQVASAEERFYTPWYSPHNAAWYIDIDDLVDDTGLAVEIAGVDVTADCILLPRNAGAKLKPWTMLLVPSDGEASVTAVWGWDGFPAAIVNATLLQASRLVKRRDAPFGVAGSPDMGNEIRLLAKIDVDVEVLIRAYRRYW